MVVVINSRNTRKFFPREQLEFWVAMNLYSRGVRKHGMEF